MPQGKIAHKIKIFFFNKKEKPIILQSEKAAGFDMHSEYYEYCIRNQRIPRRIKGYQVLIRFYEEVSHQ